MKIIITTVILAVLSPYAFAYGTFESSWIDGSNKICKYSDGTVLTIGIAETCPISN